MRQEEDEHDEHELGRDLLKLWLRSTLVSVPTKNFNFLLHTLYTFYGDNIKQEIGSQIL